MVVPGLIALHCMSGLSLHVCLACLNCLLLLPLQTEGVPSPRNLDVTMPQAGCCIAVGLEYGCPGVPQWGPQDTQA